METGAFTSYFDVAQIAIWGFWLFFAGLIFYLRSEDKREGYPLISDAKRRVLVQGFPPIPSPKTFLLDGGEKVLSPRAEPPEVVNLRATANWPGAPYAPTGNPMLDGVGPAAYSRIRADHPDHSLDDNQPKIVPLLTLPDFFLATEDPDPRGMEVIGADGVAAGTAMDVWIDRSETVVRFVEVELAQPIGSGRILLPFHYVQIRSGKRQLRVGSITGAQFADVPRLREPETVTCLEEDKLMAYFAGGLLYATPARLEPLL